MGHRGRRNEEKGTASINNIVVDEKVGKRQHSIGVWRARRNGMGGYCLITGGP